MAAQTLTPLSSSIGFVTTDVYAYGVKTFRKNSPYKITGWNHTHYILMNRHGIVKHVPKHLVSLAG